MSSDMTAAMRTRLAFLAACLAIIARHAARKASRVRIAAVMSEDIAVSLSARSAVFVRGSEHAASVSERHLAAGRIVRAVARTEAFDDHDVAGLHRVFRDSPTLQHAWRSA